MSDARPWRVTWSRRGTTRKRRFVSEWQATQFAECLPTDERAQVVTIDNTRTGETFYR